MTEEIKETREAKKPKEPKEPKGNSTTTYIMRLTNGEVRKVTVPSNWKVTFGPTIPFSPTKINVGYSQPNYDKSYAVRFYEGNKENLKAVFGDVRDFRSADIVVEERITEVQRKVVQEDIPGQGFKDVEVEARVSRWCDPLQEQTPASNKFLAEISGGGK